VSDCDYGVDINGGCFHDPQCQTLERGIAPRRRRADNERVQIFQPRKGATVEAVTEEQRTRVRSRVVGLLNEVEYLLTGWVLKEDREEVAALAEPLYLLADKEETS
jgi:hypothetical protein